MLENVIMHIKASADVRLHILFIGTCSIRWSDCSNADVHVILA